jgi:circadian clock protein KaiB
VKNNTPRKDKRYLFKLYITGATSRSTKALTNLKSLCETHLPGRYELEVIDIYQQPNKARTEQILAAPTLVKILPSPLRRFIGDLSDSEQLLAHLQIVVKQLSKQSSPSARLAHAEAKAKGR